MAGRGPAPKPAAERVRRNADPAPEVTVEPDAELRGDPLPELPPVLDDDGEWRERPWPELTKAWWETWRRSPQAKTFTLTDWDFLLETALLHRAFVGGNLSLASELRLRAAKFGATVEDRMRLRLQIADPGPAPTPAPKPSPKGRKERLLKAVS